jgi:dTDP-L-rhamnose 4-epimerase
VTSETVLITGGAGFIGSHTADRLLAAGYRVKVLDSLIPQVHGEGQGRPPYLSAEVELQIGDVRDAAAVDDALEDVAYVYHLAADTGVGQSMYAVGQYFSTNVVGTAQLWEGIQKRQGQIKHFILASSRAVYGEGRYSCARCGDVVPQQRSEDQLLRADWSQHCPVCSAELEPRPSDETTQPGPVSVYGLTKKIQEDICQLMGTTSGVPIAILRYFNVYGPRQSVTNPYTGVIPMFCTRIRSGRPIHLYERGVPLRDFVHVNDVVDANVAALDLTGPVDVVNVGSGKALSLREVAEILCSVLGVAPNFQLTTKFRVGDILGCYANLDRSSQLVGREERIAFREGFKTLLPWLATQGADDRSEQVESELRLKGVLKEGATSPCRPDL